MTEMMMTIGGRADHDLSDNGTDADEADEDDEDDEDGEAMMM